jgi:hypothetical protein
MHCLLFIKADTGGVVGAIRSQCGGRSSGALRQLFDEIRMRSDAQTRHDVCVDNLGRCSVRITGRGCFEATAAGQTA